MRPKEAGLATHLEAALVAHAQGTRALPGVATSGDRESLIEQLVESIRRVRFVSVIAGRDINSARLDPSSELFDPIRAALVHKAQGTIEEAYWLVFLFIHFGKSLRTGWRLARDIYGALGGANRWDWARTSADPIAFAKWLSTNVATLQGGDGVDRQFGNHRKYETLKPSSDRSTAKVVESYVKWVGPPRTHQQLMNHTLDAVGRDPRKAFDSLYRSMDDVVSFGRTARFDYLTMIGKLGLAAIEPGSTYLKGATGPLAGARLLYGGTHAGALDRSKLELWLKDLEASLPLGQHGMQVLEDALCNWQKSPHKFVPFRG